MVGEGTIGDGTWESIRDDVETSVRDAVRRAHGVIDGGFEATVIGGDCGDGGACYAFCGKSCGFFPRRICSQRDRGKLQDQLRGSLRCAHGGDSYDAWRNQGDGGDVFVF